MSGSVVIGDMRGDISSLDGQLFSDIYRGSGAQVTSQSAQAQSGTGSSTVGGRATSLRHFVACAITLRPSMSEEVDLSSEQLEQQQQRCLLDLPPELLTIVLQHASPASRHAHTIDIHNASVASMRHPRPAVDVSICGSSAREEGDLRHRTCLRVPPRAGWPDARGRRCGGITHQRSISSRNGSF